MQPLQYAVLTASASGATAVVGATAGKKIKVLFYDLMVNGAVNVKFQSNATDLTGLYYFDAAGKGKVNDTNYDNSPWFETAVGEALNINLSAAVAVGGVVGYILV